MIEQNLPSTIAIRNNQNQAQLAVINTISHHKPSSKKVTTPDHQPLTTPFTFHQTSISNSNVFYPINTNTIAYH